MVTRNNPAATKPKVSPAVVVAVIVVLVLFLAWRAYATFTPSGMATSAQMQQQVEQQAFLKKKAKECNGDFTKLTEQDQTKIQQITSGHGEFAIRTMAARTE